jgi:hypothetical protein
MDRFGLGWVAAPACALVLTAGCVTTQPSYAERSGGFGYVGAGYIVDSSFFGNVDGVKSGHGATLTVPLAPGTFGVVAATALVAAMVALDCDANLDIGDSWLDDPEAWNCGYSEPGQKIISEFSVDLTFSGSRHEDELYGGNMDYFASLVGVKFGAPRHYFPRYYLTGGMGIYAFDYDRRPDAVVTGPYAGAGLELFTDPALSLAVDYRAHFYSGEDDAGAAIDGGTKQISLVMSCHW